MTLTILRYDKLSLETQLAQTLLGTWDGVREKTPVESEVFPTLEAP